MAPGQFNSHSKNYNGMHTGDGKKQKKGIYSLNGRKIKRESHRVFTPGTNVTLLKTGQKGVVLKKECKVPRSLIHILVDSKKLYCQANLIYRNDPKLHNTVTRVKKPMNQSQKERWAKFKERKQNELCTINKLKKESIAKKQLFKKYKREFNELIDSGVQITQNGDKFTFTKQQSSNVHVNSTIEHLYNKCLELNKSLHSNLVANKHIIPKYQILDICKLTNCGSTLNMTKCSNNQDFYQLVHQYGESLDK